MRLKFVWIVHYGNNLSKEEFSSWKEAARWINNYLSDCADRQVVVQRKLLGAVI